VGRDLPNSKPDKGPWTPPAEAVSMVPSKKRAFWGAKKITYQVRLELFCGGGDLKELLEKKRRGHRNSLGKQKKQSLAPQGGGVPGM